MWKPLDNKKIAELFSVRGEMCYTYFKSNTNLFEIGLKVDQNRTPEGYIPLFDFNGIPSQNHAKEYSRVLLFNDDQIIKTPLNPAKHQEDVKAVSRIEKVLNENQVLNIVVGTPVPGFLYSFESLKENFPEMYVNRKLSMNDTNQYLTTKLFSMTKILI